MRYRTVICVLLVAGILPMAMLLGCGQEADEAIPAAEEVRATEVVAPDVVADVPKQDEATSSAPPVTPATPEPSKAEQSQPTPPADPDLVTTTFPPLDMRFSIPPNDGPSSLERRIADSDVIAIVRLTNAVSAVETITDGEQTGYVGALKFTFNVQEILKAPVGSSPTQIVAMVGSMQGYAERSDAQARATKMAAERDTQWDDRNAIVFLATHSLDYPGTSSDDLYYMAYIDYTYGLGDGYSLASERNRLWLPEARVGGAAGTPQQRRFLTGVPQPSTETETPSIALSELKSKISAINTELSANSAEGYQSCVRDKYRRVQYEAIWAARGDTYDSAQTFKAEIGSGLTAGIDVVDNTWKVVYDQNGWESRSELAGTNAALFRIGEPTKTGTGTIDDVNSFLAFRKKIEYEARVQPIETARPLPAATYDLTWKFQRGGYILCDPDYVINHTVIVAVTAPDGTLHEMFFDPVTVGSAAKADGTNGVLKPATFTDANGGAVTINGISYESDAVKVELTPNDALDDHILDFIKLDGTVSLSLDVADATVDPSTGSGQAGTLSWSVASQPWEDGDKLMVRIWEAR